MTLRHSPYIVTDGLRLLYDPGNTKCYPGSGTSVNDLSRNGQIGTLTNAAIGTAVPDVFDFTGTGQLNFPSTTTRAIRESSPTGTLTTWVNMDVSTDQVIFFTDENRDRYFYLEDNYYKSAAYNGTTAQFEILTSNDIVSVNEWVYLSFDYEQNNGANAVYNFYVNGVLNENITTSTTTDAANASNTWIGNNVGASQNLPAMAAMNGKVAHFSIYNRILTADEVMQNYNAQKNRYT